MDFKNPKQKHGRFINPHIEDLKRGLVDFARWQSGYYDDKQDCPSPPTDFFYPADPPPIDLEKPIATWLGHSTYLVQVGDVSFLTDPLFSSHCSPVPISVLKRQHPPALNIADLPQIQFVLLSHNHYDHLDAKSIRSLYRRFPNIVFIVPRGVKRWFRRRGMQNVIELDWGGSFETAHLRITATPAQHFSGRALWDKNRTLWCGYVVEIQGKTFYFAGDTGYNPVQFKEIGKCWEQIDLSLIPIGTYVPKAFMQPVHISPKEAVEIHSDIGSRLSLGMHWKTFCLSDEPIERPPYDLYLAMREKKLPYESFLPLEPGQSVNF